MVKLRVEGKTPYCETLGEAGSIATMDDLMDLLGHCGSHKTRRLLIHPENLPADFFDLKTRLAGEMLQKFSTYRMKVAIRLDERAFKNPRFREMAGEANRFGDIGYFRNQQEAEEWIQR